MQSQIFKSRTRKNSSMQISVAWLLVAICGCLLAQSEFGATAPLGSQSQEPGESVAALLELAAASPTNGQRLLAARQQQIFRRRRSSEQLWPANAAPQRRFGQQQQRLAGDAAFSQQLAELIAQARNDKALERTLLRMLINATLRPSPAAAVSAPAELDPSLGSPASIDQLLASAERAQREQQAGVADGGAHQALSLIEYLEQRLNNSPGFVDQSSAASGNDLGQLTFGVDKREFKPCSFNAISCVKSPFRSS